MPARSVAAGCVAKPTKGDIDMYIRRRVCAEQDMKGGHVHVWVYQANGENLNDLISVSQFNLGSGCTRIDKAPSQETLPGCVWQGRSEENIDWDGDETHCVVHCMIFNVSKCWYSTVLSRETTGGSDRRLDWYGRFLSPEQAVDFLVDPKRGLWVCSEDDLKKAYFEEY